MDVGLPPLARRLINLREAAGLSQAELARRAKLSRMTLCQLERGMSAAKWTTVQSLALALGTDCGVFMDPVPALPMEETPAQDLDENCCGI